MLPSTRSWSRTLPGPTRTITDNNYFTLNADGTVDAGPKCSNFEKWEVTAVDRITIFFKSYDYENAEGGHFIYDFYYDGDKVVKLDWGDGIVGCYLRK